MLNDPIVEEVRRIRRDIEKEFGSDHEAFYRHVRETQKALGDRVVSRGPRPLAILVQKDT